MAGILDELVTIHPLQLMLDLYIALLAGLACVLEVKSTLLRDHLTLSLERHCALLRFATGRGCVYFATGFLAFDVHEKAQVLGGGMLLAVGLFNVALGTCVAPTHSRGCNPTSMSMSTSTSMSMSMSTSMSMSMSM